MFLNFRNTTGGQYTQYISTTDLCALVIEISASDVVDGKIMYGITITPTYVAGDDKVFHIGDIDFDVCEEELNKLLDKIRKTLGNFEEICEKFNDVVTYKIDRRITLVDASKIISVRLYEDDEGERHKIILNNGSELEFDLKSSLEGFMRKLLFENT